MILILLLAIIALSVTTKKPDNSAACFSNDDFVFAQTSTVNDLGFDNGNGLFNSHNDILDRDAAICFGNSINDMNVLSDGSGFYMSQTEALSCNAMSHCGGMGTGSGFYM